MDEIDQVRLFWQTEIVSILAGIMLKLLFSVLKGKELQVAVCKPPNPFHTNIKDKKIEHWRT